MQKILSSQLGSQLLLSEPISGPFAGGRSGNEKFSKICIVVEEADESVYWIDLFIETGYGDSAELKWISDEAVEILKVTSKIKSSLSP